MERFVWDYRLRSGLAWTVAIVMFVAVTVFGAPPIAILGVLVAELLFITSLNRRYPHRLEQKLRRR